MRPLPKNPVYTVTRRPNRPGQFLVTNRKTRDVDVVEVQDFMRGSRFFDERTDRYPDYVYELVYALWHRVDPYQPGLRGQAEHSH